MPFHLWPDQESALKDIHANDRVIILKARQLGISWIVCAYVLWYAKFQRGKNCWMLSRKEKAGFELIRRIASLHERLPEWLRSYSPLAKPPKTDTICFANGSKILSEAATQTAGSGEAASILVMDEAAKMQWARRVYSSAKPAIDNGKTKFIMLSTAFGAAGFFTGIVTE